MLFTETKHSVDWSSHRVTNKQHSRSTWVLGCSIALFWLVISCMDKLLVNLSAV